MASYLLKCTAEQLDRYKRAASASGYNLAEFLRAAADSAADVVEGRVSVQSVEGQWAAPSGSPSKRGKGKRARTGPCEHRVPAAAFCKRCD